MAAFLNNITALVSLNGSMAITIVLLHYKDKTIPVLAIDEQRVKVIDSNILDLSDIFMSPFQAPGNQSLIPLEKAEAQLLFIVGQNDHFFRSDYYATECGVSKTDSSSSEIWRPLFCVSHPFYSLLSAKE